MKYLIKIKLNQLNQPVVEVVTSIVESTDTPVSNDIYQKIGQKIGFQKLEQLIASLDDEFSCLLDAVVAQELEDFCPEWMLNCFMEDNFEGNERYGENATLFYRHFGCRLRDQYADKQDKTLTDNL